MFSRFEKILLSLVLILTGISIFVFLHPSTIFALIGADGDGGDGGGGGEPTYCGDGICEGSEDCNNCPTDCGTCPPSCTDECSPSGATNGCIDANTLNICSNCDSDSCLEWCSQTCDYGCCVGSGTARCRTCYERCVCLDRSASGCNKERCTLECYCITCGLTGDTCTENTQCCSENYCSSGHCCPKGFAWDSGLGICIQQTSCYNNPCPYKPPNDSGYQSQWWSETACIPHPPK
ncbi:MAG: hypothetical protein QXD48_02100, partial [Candidatus Aenigmatarchaeota archaeon]